MARDETRSGKPWIVFVVVAFAGLAVASAWGGSHGPIDGLAWTLSKTWNGALVSIAVLGTAWGIGGWLRPVFRGGRERNVLRFGAGFGALTLGWYVLGTIGWLGPFAAWALVGLATTRLVVDVIEARGRVRLSRAPSPWLWAGLAGFCVMLVAASNPTGALWDSEYRGYDAVSYHLPLPQEWIAMGRVWPLEHCVYSYLPSAMEALYAWAGVLSGAPGERGLVADDGWRLTAMQHLHAFVGIVGVWATAAAARRTVVLSGLGPGAARTSAWIAGGLAATTPWFVVVGSLAYNETAVIAVGAIALVAALESRLRAWQRGVLCGGLVGVACLFKPTAIVLVAPIVGFVMVAVAWKRPPKDVPNIAVAVVIGAVAGGLALLPWLIRNWIAADGNPFFPLLTDLFGHAHWSAEQAARWNEAHAADEGLLERLRLAVWSDPGARDGADSIELWRGFANPQWGALWLLVLTGGGLALARAGRIAMVLWAGMLAGVAAWLAITHVQSRFLIPLLPVAAILVSLGLVSLRERFGPRPVLILGIVVVGLQSLTLGRAWLVEKEGSPNLLLALGTGFLLGENYSELAGQTSPPAWVNAHLPEDAKLLVVADAGVLYFDRELVWASVWDQEQMLPGGDDWSAAWTERVHELGVTHVFVNLVEVARQHQNGYSERTPDEVLQWAQSQGRVLIVWEEKAQGVIEVRDR
ncbi:MAG: hypothetical protein AAGI53_16800 [Planctomycetota bacterium]